MRDGWILWFVKYSKIKNDSTYARFVISPMRIDLGQINVKIIVQSIVHVLWRLQDVQLK